MKRIGILTFHRADNFGAMLQAYALCEYLNRLEDTTAEIIDYRATSIEARNQTLPLEYLREKTIKAEIKSILTVSNVLQTRQKFNQFRNDRMRLSRMVRREQLKELAAEYDIFISGSDQVWNPEITRFDTSYFLDFAGKDNLLCSYAASVGEDRLIQENNDFYNQQLSRFSSISVRELSTQLALERLLHKPVRRDVDPVFLLTKEQWSQIETPVKRNPYILAFKMGTHKSGEYILNFARELGRKKRKEVIFLSDKDPWYKYWDLQHYGVASVAEFLGLIHGADTVITNSFHGTSFSLIFNKPFYVETNIPRFERIENLFTICDIDNCRLVKGTSAGNVNGINWSTVNKNLQAEAEKSRAYLRSIVERKRI